MQKKNNPNFTCFVTSQQHRSIKLYTNCFYWDVLDTSAH